MDHFGKLDFEEGTSSRPGLHPPVPGLFRSIIGLLLYPSDTVERLLTPTETEAKNGFVPAPHAWSILATLFAVIFGPLAYQVLHWDFLETRIESVVALVIVLCFTAVWFVILEYIMLRLFAEPVTPKRIFALMAYGCAPLIPLVVIFYIVDYALFGRLTIVTFVVTGVQNANDPTMKAFPVMQLIGKLLFLYVFYWGLRFVRGVGPIGGAVMTVLSAVPFYLGFILSVCLVELGLPGSMNGIRLLATSVFGLFSAP